MKKKSMIVFMLMVAFVTLCVFTIAFAGEFRIGLLFPQTGQHAIWGKYQAQGAEIAQDIINERGGIKGNKIVYVKVDASDPTVAASECTRLITQEKVKLIIGSGIAGNATAATGVADKAKVAYYETTTATSPITERGFRYTFRSVFKASMAGERLTEFIYEYLPKLMGKGPKDLKIVVAHEDGPLGSSLCEGIKTGAKSKGLELPVVLTYSAKSSDLSSLILKLKSMGPDILAGISYLQDAMLLTKQMKQYNLAPKVFYCVGPGWTSPEYIADRGKDINGFFVSWAPACIDPRALTNEGKELHRQLLSRYRKKFGEEPVDFSGYTFAGCYILFNEVLPRAASLDPDKIREAIFKVDKPIGSYPNGWGAKFDETGQNTRCFPVDSQYQDMEPVFLCPEAIASGKPIMVPLPPWKARN